MLRNDQDFVMCHKHHSQGGQGVIHDHPLHRYYSHMRNHPSRSYDLTFLKMISEEKVLSENS